MTGENRRFRLGASTVQLLLPHRPPMLFVDLVTGYEVTPRPSLRAARHISANDETFRGHFSDFGIWPGVFTVEGLNQACNILGTISGMQNEWLEAGRDPARVLDALQHIDQVAALRTPLGADEASPVLGALQSMQKAVGFSVGIDVRLSAPVFAGSRLDYIVTEIDGNGPVVRYDVEALVDGSSVARGKLMLSRPRPIPSFGGSRK